MIGEDDPATAPDEKGIHLLPSLRGVRAAFVFFTRFPVGGSSYRSEDHSWAPAHAPLVGLVLGGLAGLTFVALEPLGTLAASVFSVIALVWSTGALHEDGLADTADALGGASTRERTFEILKDSRIGTYGAAALCLSLAARIALVQQLGASALWALPLSECAARVGPACLIGALPYVTSPGSARSGAVVRAGGARVAVATAWGALAVVAAVISSRLSAARALSVAAALAATWLLLGRLFHRRLGGVTGDFLGAAVQIGEVAALAVLAWRG